MFQFAVFIACQMPLKFGFPSAVRAGRAACPDGVGIEPTNTAVAVAAGLERINLEPSPITGASGNREFFLHLRLAPAAGGVG